MKFALPVPLLGSTVKAEAVHALPSSEADQEFSEVFDGTAAVPLEPNSPVRPDESTDQDQAKDGQDVLSDAASDMPAQSFDDATKLPIHQSNDSPLMGSAGRSQPISTTKSDQPEMRSGQQGAITKIPQSTTSTAHVGPGLLVLGATESGAATRARATPDTVLSHHLAQAPLVFPAHGKPGATGVDTAAKSHIAPNTTQFVFGPVSQEMPDNAANPTARIAPALRQGTIHAASVGTEVSSKQATTEPGLVLVSGPVVNALPANEANVSETIGVDRGAPHKLAGLATVSDAPLDVWNNTPSGLDKGAETSIGQLKSDSFFQAQTANVAGQEMKGAPQHATNLKEARAPLDSVTDLAETAHRVDPDALPADKNTLPLDVKHPAESAKVADLGQNSTATDQSDVKHVAYQWSDAPRPQTSELPTQPIEAKNRLDSPVSRPRSTQSPVPGQTDPARVAQGLVDQSAPLSEVSLDTEGLELSSLVEISAPKSHAASVAQSPIKPGLSSQIMPHVADLSVSKGERVEITLSPDELGRVRLSATQTDAGVVLVVQAERPETLDLMRRHMPDLLRDLQDMGFADINYSEGEQREHTEPNTSSTPETIEPQETPPPTQHIGSSGLDMRL